ncbi:peptidylprolyl isomerase [Malassezia psittaci]|uniref:peptidylprolyl isomerase n=1 Tax=Malassezia psittaci TaxID=1821823 RepID=A0AAF0F878_9BASI|nr:peptidylprolyl isomerase [Malassezia psittaci]
MTWEVRFSNTRQLPYFYNPDTQVSMWELPEGMTEEQARNLPGGSLLGEARPDQQLSTQGSEASHAKESVRASHILVKHKDSRRPSSHKQSVITRTKEEAIQLLRTFQQKLGQHPTPEQFSELAREHSDCSSARQGGDLGHFGRGQMQPAFEKAAFDLPVGETSGVVDTDSGVHLIQRTAAVNFVPTDKIQTAVSYMDGYMVIDTLIPPSHYLPPTLDVTKLAAEMQTDLVNELNRLRLGKGSSVGAIAHPRSQEVEAEQFIRMPNGKLIDPALAPTGHPDDSRRARLGIRSLRGEPLLSYFPSPSAAEATYVNGVKTSCPCVCCRSNCPGANPHTKRLPVIESALAHDQYGHILLDENTPLVPSSSTSSSNTATELPREDEIRIAVKPSGPVANSTTLGAPFAETSSGRSVVRLVNGKREVHNVAPHKSLGDLRATAPLQSNVAAERRHMTPPRKLETWQQPVSPSTRVTMRSSGIASNSSAKSTQPVNDSAHMPSSRMEKGMSVFAPLQLSDDLEHQLSLHEQVSPRRGTHTITPPLSSPSSFTSSRSQRETDSSPGSNCSVDPSSTPIAARYSRSSSNLRQKARDREVPPLPRMPTTVPDPKESLRQPKPSFHDALEEPVLPQRSSTPGGARVRIVAGNSPLNRSKQLREHA